MTGETANGRSISVIRTFFPTKLNFAIAHAAASPKTRFSGTVIAAASRVRLIDASAAGSVRLVKYGPRPLRSAYVNTAASGITRKSPRNAIETVTHTHLAKGECYTRVCVTET